MRPVLQNTAIKNCFRFSSSVVCWSFCVQFNHLLRDILGLGPPLGPFPLACVSIVPYQKVRAASLFDACAVIAPHSLQVVLMSFSTPPSLTASLQLSCLQGQDKTEEQIQGQAGRHHVRAAAALGWAAHRRKQRMPSPVWHPRVESVFFPLVQFICNLTFLSLRRQDLFLGSPRGRKAAVLSSSLVFALKSTERNMTLNRNLFHYTD